MFEDVLLWPNTATPTECSILYQKETQLRWFWLCLLFALGGWVRWIEGESNHFERKSEHQFSGQDDCNSVVISFDWRKNWRQEHLFALITRSDFLGSTFDAWYFIYNRCWHSHVTKTSFKEANFLSFYHPAFSSRSVFEAVSFGTRAITSSSTSMKENVFIQRIRNTKCRFCEKGLQCHSQEKCLFSY